MKLKVTLPYFLLALQEGQDFPSEPMQELDRILAGLESDEEKTIAAVKAWFRNHQDIYNDIIKFAKNDSDRQKTKSSKSSPTDEIGIVQNLYELREKNPHKRDPQNRPR